VVRELARDAEVSALIGPLLADASEAAGAVAEESGLPLLTLTRREDVPLLGPFVLRLGATPRLEAELLADYAVGELGIERFAVLYPEDSYGLIMRDAFWDAVEARGGEVVGVAHYTVDATDFAEPIRRLIGYELLSAAERQALAERERLLKRAKRLPPEAAAELRLEASEITGPDDAPLPPFVDFDAIFIPDAYEKAALIAAHLAFHEVRGVRLLGPSGWSHPDLLSIGGSYVNGAIFTSSYYAGSRYPFVSEFARRFRETFGSEPTYVAAQAFDAANLVLAQWVKGHASRVAVLTGLLDTQDYPGASGITTIDPNGSAQKRPHLLGVERGRVISIDEVGEPPYLRQPTVPDEEDEELPQAGVSSQ
jgi:ABC-type branched-subunit amino acid transport system substrate-binding protein